MPPDYQKKNFEQKASKDADQTEWDALTLGSSPIDGGLSDDIIADALDDFQEDEYEGHWYQQDVVTDTAVGAVHQELINREKLIGPLYPFEIDKNALLPIAKSRNLTYEFCLSISIQKNITCKPYTLLPRTFEIVCTELTKLHLGEYAQALHTGWPRQSNVPISFKALAEEIHQKTKEWWWGPDDGLNDYDSNHIKDSGIDFIVWNQSPDKSPGQLFITGQCACGDDWDNKYGEAKPENYNIWFNPVSWVSPTTAFCTPHRLVSGYMYEASKKAGIVYERLRLAALGKQHEDKLSQELKDKMEECINIVKVGYQKSGSARATASNNGGGTALPTTV